ncbi:hypothetical protein QFZ73_002885 [Peribacillus sp. V2I11]|nr:hypothetical protein [Peribacillus sp. V2I11]
MTVPFLNIMIWQERRDGGQKNNEERTKQELGPFGL